jgi:hypothetical protein
MTNYSFIRHFASVLLGVFFCTHAYAQHTTQFLFTETVSDNLRNTMQTNATALFAEINRAAHDKERSWLTLSTANATTEAIQRIQTLWATSHFYTAESGTVIQKVLKSSNGYQVRNISVIFEEGATDEDKEQDIVIEFNKSGKISDIYIAMPWHQYAKIMGNSNEVSDVRHRQMVLEQVENLRTAYNRKDMSFLETIYSEDALIITGKVITRQKRMDTPVAFNQQKIEYSVQNKKQYLTKLKNAFARNSYIKIKFDEIIVTRHEGNPNIYGVTLKQNWKSSTYSDEGWLFLIFDYKDEENPQIWVRTWQPLQDSSGNPIHYSSEDIFNLGDFPFK